MDLQNLLRRAINPPKWLGPMFDLTQKTRGVRYNPSSFYGPSAFIPDLGMECSAGHFSRVFIFDDFVIKVSSAAGDGARAYLKYCYEHPAKHLPVVYHCEERDGLFFAVMERLARPWDSEDECCDFLGKHTYRSIKDACYYGDGYDSDRQRQWGEPVEAEQAVPEDAQSAYEQAVKIHEMFNVGYNMDLHAHNLMLRADGTIVLTDPVAGVRNAF